MILRLKPNDYLRLRGARGVAIQVLAGRVWITEDGRRRDSFLGPGRGYRVGGDGLVLVGAETAGDTELLIKASSSDTAAPAPRAATARPD